MIYQFPQPKHDVTLKGPEPNDDMDETWDDANTYPVSKYLNIHCYIFYVNKFMAENVVSIL